MPTSAKWFVALLPVGLVLSANAQVTKVAGGYLLRVHYVNGEVIRDRMVSEVSGLAAGGRPLRIPFDVVVRVLSVKGRQAQLEIAMNPVRLGSATVAPGAKIIATVNDRNQPADPGSAPPGTAQLPAKPIRPGDVWTASMPVSTGTGTSILTGTYRFIGLRTNSGRPVAVVQYTLSGTANGHGAETLLIRDGTILSNVVDLSLAGFKVHSVMTRL